VLTIEERLADERFPLRVEDTVAQDWSGAPLVDRCQRHAATDVSASSQEGET
jgi:hypothetical protein